MNSHGTNCAVPPEHYSNLLPSFNDDGRCSGTTSPGNDRRVRRFALFSFILISRRRSALSDTPSSTSSGLGIQLGDDPESDNDSEDEQFLYPGGDAPYTMTGDNGHVPTPPAPSPAQLEALYAAASSGDLPLLKRLFATALESGDVGSFSLANVASSRTGFTTLHAAASRGYLDIVTWCMLQFRSSLRLTLIFCISGGRLWRHAGPGR